MSSGKNTAVRFWSLLPVFICLLFFPFHRAAAENLDNWNLKVMGFDLLQEQAAQDSRLQVPLLVAVIDTGCDTNHELFQGRISEDSRSFYGDANDYSDHEGHGTAVAGVIAAATPETVKLLIIKVAEGGSYVSDEQMNRAILYALDSGADVINFSIAVTSGAPVSQDFRIWSEAIRRCREKGVPFVVAAGNDGKSADYVFPAASRNAVAVSGITPQGKLQRHSNRGAAIRFCAPGTWIRVPQAGTKDEYQFTGGTSVAAPHITAAYAWLKMLNPEADCNYLEERLGSVSVIPEDADNGSGAGFGLPVISRLIPLPDPAEGIPVIPRAGLISGDEGFSGEGPENALDGDPDTKWCFSFSGLASVEWSIPEPAAPEGILLVTGNDNARHPGRNPAQMKLFGKEDPDAEWVCLWEQAADQALPDRDYAFCRFGFPRSIRKYAFFRLEIHASGGSDVVQLSMVSLY